MAGSKYYGQFGGQYVSESLMNTLAELEKAFDEAIRDPEFAKDYIYYLQEYVGRARQKKWISGQERNLGSLSTVL